MNEMVRKGLSTIVDITKKGITIASPFIVSSLINGTAKEVIDKIRYSGNVKYDDAVKVILDSDMLSSYKKEAMELLKTDEESKYYKSVVYMIQSSLLSSDKIKMIKTLNGEDGEA